MRTRISQSPWAWSLLLLWFTVILVDEADATLCAAEHVQAATAVGISLLDVWAGVSSFSDGFANQAHVPVLERGWIECAPAAVALLSAVYAGAKSCSDFYNYAWTEWKFRYDLVVTSGPSCCPFSLSGKRLRHHDERSAQGMDTTSLSVQLGAAVLVVENVSLFLEEDHIHKLVSEMEHYLHDQGYVLVASWTLLESELGGASGRGRVFLVWESIEMASWLPPWPEPPPQQQPSRLSAYLESPHLTAPLRVGGQSEYVS